MRADNRHRGWLEACGAACVCLVLAACGDSTSEHHRITVTPTAGLADRARAISASNFRPHQLVAIMARSVLPSSVWAATASFRANRRGVVDLANAPSVSGSYRGISEMGLFWAQHRVSSRRHAAGPLSASWYKTHTTFTVKVHGLRLASTTTTQTLLARGVTLHVERLATTGFTGIYFTPPPGTRRHPAVVVWGGSEGGFGESPAWAALLASHGFPSLALAYFAEPGLPPNLSRIPLEYFVKAIRWLRSQAGVDRSRTWILSASRGSEAQLLVASRWPGLVHGLVAVSPSAFVYGGLGCEFPSKCPSWTLHGRPLSMTHAPLGAATYHADGSVSDVTGFLAGLANKAANRAARIPIARFRGPVCLLSGGDDQLWPSDYYADQIMAELRGDRAAHVHLNYPRAGHLVFDIPYRPTATKTPLGNFVLDLGGTNSAYESAHASDWPFVLRFIATH